VYFLFSIKNERKMKCNIYKNFVILHVVSILCFFPHDFSFAINHNDPLEKKTSNDSNSYVVVIDPAHGGRDSGSRGVNLNEKILTLKVARLLKNKISRHKKIKVILTRETDKELTNSQRTGVANYNNADLFLTIHADASWRIGDRGPSVFVSSPQRPARLKGESQIAVSYRWERGQNVHLVKSIGFAKRLLKQFDSIDKSKKAEFHILPLKILEGARMPAVYINMGVISSPEDEARLSEINEKNSYISSIVSEVLTFFDIKFQ
tara:strand:+ start:1561 stop:2349 length:789 start_codon:yes stop_codon:yes gene_type:complete